VSESYTYVLSKLLRYASHISGVQSLSSADAPVRSKIFDDEFNHQILLIPISKYAIQENRTLISLPQLELLATSYGL